MDVVSGKPGQGGAGKEEREKGEEGMGEGGYGARSGSGMNEGGGRISPIAFDILLIKKMPDSLTGPVFNPVIHNIC
jgi:hypothetical protein